MEITLEVELIGTKIITHEIYLQICDFLPFLSFSAFLPFLLRVICSKIEKKKISHESQNSEIKLQKNSNFIKRSRKKCELCQSIVGEGGWQFCQRIMGKCQFHQRVTKSHQGSQKATSWRNLEKKHAFCQRIIGKKWISF